MYWFQTFSAWSRKPTVPAGWMVVTTVDGKVSVTRPVVSVVNVVVVGTVCTTKLPTFPAEVVPAMISVAPMYVASKVPAANVQVPVEASTPSPGVWATVIGKPSTGGVGV